MIFSPSFGEYLLCRTTMWAVFLEHYSPFCTLAHSLKNTSIFKLILFYRNIITMMAILECDYAEPLYGTLCLYHRDRREKLSEDFHFRCLPSEFQDVSALNNECCNFPTRGIIFCWQRISSTWCEILNLVRLICRTVVFLKGELSLLLRQRHQQFACSSSLKSTSLKKEVSLHLSTHEKNLWVAVKKTSVGGHSTLLITDQSCFT